MTDAARFADLLGAGLVVTINGTRQTMIALDTTATAVLLGAWNAPPGDGGISGDPRWINADTIEGVEPFTFDPDATQADPPPPGDDPAVDPRALTYPPAPEEQQT